MNSPIPRILCLLLICWSASTAEPAAAAPSRLVANLAAGKAQHLVTYGTSLTAGGAWVGQVQQELDRRYPHLLTVTNSGQGGMWSNWGVEHLDERVISKHPDTVLIEFGINDGFLEYKTSVEAAHTNLVTMVTKLRAALPQCEIFLMTMNQPVREHAERRPHFADYEAMYRTTAAEQKTRLIDLLPAWEREFAKDAAEWNAIVPDGIHPNGDGSAKITTPGILTVLLGTAP